MAKTNRKKLSDYTPDGKNINQGSEYGTHLLRKSIQEVGLGRSVLADKHGKLIGGNKTAEMAAELGFEEVIEVETNGRQLVVVRRTDLELDSAEGRKMAILDNTVQKHNYVEDIEIAEVHCEEYDLTPAQLGIDLNHDYKQKLDPTYNHKEVSDDDIKKAATKLDEALNDRSKLKEVICPECANTFHINI